MSSVFPSPVEETELPALGDDIESEFERFFQNLTSRPKDSPDGPDDSEDAYGTDIRSILNELRAITGKKVPTKDYSSLTYLLKDYESQSPARTSKSLADERKRLLEELRDLKYQILTIETTRRVNEALQSKDSERKEKVKELMDRIFSNSN